MRICKPLLTCAMLLIVALASDPCAVAQAANSGSAFSDPDLSQFLPPRPADDQDPLISAAAESNTYAASPEQVQALSAAQTSQTEKGTKLSPFWSRIYGPYTHTACRGYAEDGTLECVEGGHDLPSVVQNAWYQGRLVAPGGVLSLVNPFSLLRNYRNSREQAAETQKESGDLLRDALAANGPYEDIMVVQLANIWPAGSLVPVVLGQKDYSEAYNAATEFARNNPASANADMNSYLNYNENFANQEVQPDSSYADAVAGIAQAALVYAAAQQEADAVAAQAEAAAAMAQDQQIQQGAAYRQSPAALNPRPQNPSPSPQSGYGGSAYSSCDCRGQGPGCACTAK